MRLRARDYSSPGNYFVTLCAHEQQMLFGDVVDGVMHLNDMGRTAESFWREIPPHFPHAELDKYVIMPNHVHGIIRIVDNAWPNPLPVVRAVGIPIGPDSWVAGLNGAIVGANNYSPLHGPHPMAQNHPMPRQHPRGTSRTIGSIVRGFKIAVTRWMRLHGRVTPVWQRNYHDHIIRNERSLNRIRKYIRENPANWHRDRNNPQRRV
jgi:REP element-mobilizing transposase RayT